MRVWYYPLRILRAILAAMLITVLALVARQLPVIELAILRLVALQTLPAELRKGRRQGPK